jgi:UDP-N-acetylglucosamine/UDP-N-acetylgalactosamine diphosphorylase
MKPLREVITEGNLPRGLELMKEGKVGALLLAGGMGTRLGFDGPKGMYPIGSKTLFEIMAENMAAASRFAGRELPLAVMTSSQNDRATRDYFAENITLGNVSFFTQGNLPYLLPDGSQFEEEEGVLAVGPDGNGDALKLFYESPIYREWKEQGIEYVNVFLVDNPLALPIDPALLGAHADLGVDILVKATRRKGPDEKVGVLCQEGEKVSVIEYSELSEEARKKDYPYANLSLFSVTMEWIEKAAALSLPLHKAWKKAKIRGKMPAEPNAWKFEKFIFDLFPHARTKVMVFPREEIFSPLKNKEGEASPETVARDLQRRLPQKF